MTALFDGVAGLLNDTFGASVTLYPEGGVARAVNSIFRETPVEVTDPEGVPVVITAPTWTVPKSLAADVAEGAEIVVADGRRFAIRASYPSGSPAGDSFVRFVLELVP